MLKELRDKIRQHRLLLILLKKMLNPKLAREMDGRGEAMRSHPEPSTGMERIIQEKCSMGCSGGRNQEERWKRRKG